MGMCMISRAAFLWSHDHPQLRPHKPLNVTVKLCKRLCGRTLWPLAYNLDCRHYFLQIDLVHYRSTYRRHAVVSCERSSGLRRCSHSARFVSILSCIDFIFSRLFFDLPGWFYIVLNAG